MKYNIGNLELKNRVLLAPMLEPNDIAFRLLCKKAGCGLTYTGMTSPLSKAKFNLDDKPALQLFGNSTKGIKSFMKKYDSQVSLWDFNLGCPSKLSKKLEHGAFMHEDLIGIEKILKIMRKSTKKPVTIKIRKSAKAIDIAKMAERMGIDAVCIHARDVAQGYSGDVDYDFALKIKKAVDVPVIFSGISNVDDIENILKDFDFVMMGRLSIGCPSIFTNIQKASGQLAMGNDQFSFGEYLKLAEKHGLFFRQIKYQAMNFTKGIIGGKKLRMELIGANSFFELEKLMSHMG